MFFLFQADYYTCIGTVVYLRKENCLYQACPSQDCNKKVVDQQNGMFRCEKCDKEFPNFKYRLILSVSDSATASLNPPLKKIPVSHMHRHTSMCTKAHILNSCCSCSSLCSPVLITLHICSHDLTLLFIILFPETQATSLPVFSALPHSALSS